MSYTSITQAARDPALNDRIIAAVSKEAHQNPTFGGTPYGQQVKSGTANVLQVFGFPVAIATEAAYEYAVNAGNPDPGGDPTVVTNPDILAAVQANWPPT